MHQAPCFLLGLQQQLRGFICTLRIPFMSIFLSVLTWILGGGQISRVGSILYVGALGPKMSVFPKDPELPSCQRPSAPLRGPIDSAPTLKSLYLPQIPLRTARLGCQLSSHSPTEPTCSLALHWARSPEPSSSHPSLAQTSPWACTWCSPAPGFLLLLWFSTGRTPGTWGIGEGFL